MQEYLWIAAGGACGSAARHWLSRIVVTQFQGQTHMGILLVNTTGCLLMGLLAALMDASGSPAHHPARHFLLIGVLGGYTTFSSFSLQTLHLFRQAEWLAGGLNVVFSVMGCLIAVALGYALGSLLRSG